MTCDCWGNFVRAGSHLMSMRFATLAAIRDPTIAAPGGGNKNISQIKKNTNQKLIAADPG